jgi:hypothetical protein
MATMGTPSRAMARSRLWTSSRAIRWASASAGESEGSGPWRQPAGAPAQAGETDAIVGPEVYGRQRPGHAGRAEEAFPAANGPVVEQVEGDDHIACQVGMMPVDEGPAVARGGHPAQIPEPVARLVRTELGELVAIAYPARPVRTPDSPGVGRVEESVQTLRAREDAEGRAGVDGAGPGEQAEGRAKLHPGRRDRVPTPPGRPQR